MFKSTKQRQSLDVTSGPMLGKIFSFAIPIILSGILQQTFSTADTIVVGRGASSEALGGVSACTSLINLIICIFTGLSVGATVAISQAIGARDEQRASRCAHTAIATAIFGGIFLGIVGIIISRPILKAMGTPEEIIGYSIKYMRIYFAGAPFLLLYNYGSAILRTVGDTKRPLVFLAIGGIVNVILNFVMVLGLGMDADGVAIATVTSNVIASGLVFYTLVHSHHVCRIFPGRISISFNEFKRILALGVPAGIQSGMFSLSNVVLQSSINSFGAAVVAGNGAAASVDTYAAFVSDGFSQTAMTFSGQNTGAKKYGRLKTVFWLTNLSGMAMVALVAAIIIPFRESVISLFISDNPEAVAAGCERLMWVLLPHFIGAAMTMSSSVLRGMGKSLQPMIVTVFGVCVVRMIWVVTVFEHYKTIRSLYLVYPVTWVLTLAGIVGMFWYSYFKLSRTGTMGKD